MGYFFEADTVCQICLLVLSQMTVLLLAAAGLFLYLRKSKGIRLLGMGSLFLFNAALYILLQLDSRMTIDGQGLYLQIPYALGMAVTLFSLAATVWGVLRETKIRKTINHSSIQEAFDNLPTGVCFFNESGLPVLCNRAMYRFGFAVCGKDLQVAGDLEVCFEETWMPAQGVKKEGTVFVLGDGQAWHLEKRVVHHEDGATYTQYIAADVTDLHRSRVALTQENQQLRQTQEELQRLSANVVAVTREEEILNAKMRVHDEMGRCLLAAQNCLQQADIQSVPDSLVSSWQRAVSMLKYNNDAPDEDMLLQIRRTCESVKMAFVQTGQLPGQERCAYLLTCAVRECVTNAVRYARATELYAVFTETPTEATVTVTNNGIAPEGEIREGGGLSTLRRRIERSGGLMHIRSVPSFQLTVTVPKEKEGFL